MIDDFREGCDSVESWLGFAVDEEGIPAEITGSFDVGEGVVANVEDSTSRDMILGDLE